MIKSITSIFKKVLTSNINDQSNLINPDLAMAALLSEVSAADRKTLSAEYNAKVALLERLLEISTEESQQLLKEAKKKKVPTATLR